ncbi:uncharacterized protein LOC100277088 isoform 2 [Zea mays]|uniref:Chaperone protein dnaJ-related n=1 Tax=Zea mays TaxID=4577 RepID=A0A1D6MDB5_MAIZE|nr:uncharacterized protein LOC100277088 isoform 2 [Zea mays]AQK88657.1 hypothetical protein ZEAMMB73_Zm00001d039070 [Zea mays]|eukprot:NP_001339612.1 uncharacterized protein LOC100277088 isoform 2 [Zea mays]
MLAQPAHLIPPTCSLKRPRAQSYPLHRRPTNGGASGRAEAERRHSAGQMEGLTSSEIAGFVVGALLLGATIAAPKVDGFIASSQRRSLGMCKRCGDLRIVACSQCKGTGSARSGGMLSLGMLDDLYESLGAEAKTENLVPCTKCRSRGRLLCPECSKVA